jgi:hypothetical protein
MSHDKEKTHVCMLALSSSAIEQVEDEDQGHAMPCVPVDPFRYMGCIVQPDDETDERAVVDP